MVFSVSHANPNYVCVRDFFVKFDWMLLAANVMVVSVWHYRELGGAADASTKNTRCRIHTYAQCSHTHTHSTRVLMRRLCRTQHTHTWALVHELPDAKIKARNILLFCLWWWWLVSNSYVNDKCVSKAIDRTEYTVSSFRRTENDFRIIILNGISIIWGILPIFVDYEIEKIQGNAIFGK